MYQVSDFNKIKHNKNQALMRLLDSSLYLIDLKPKNRDEDGEVERWWSEVEVELAKTEILF